MRNASRFALLAVAALAGCNLTYDREGLEFVEPATYESCTAAGKDFCSLGSRDFCTELNTDALNCGGCGVPCQPGFACDLGSCGVGSCGATTSFVVCGSAEYPVCVDTITDARNCGFCGNDCGAFSCVAGHCDVSCSGVNPDKCFEPAAGWICTDIQTDSNHCGACNNPCAGSCTGGVCPAPAFAAVAPAFPANGAGWNDWVIGTGVAGSIDTACNAGSLLDCSHAGEFRQVSVTGRGSCMGLSATDALDAFDWSCDGSTAPVRFLSTRLKAGVRLSHLLDVYTPGWLSNSVTVFDGGSTIGSTPSTVWWSNPVAFVPANGELHGAGTVFVADGVMPPPYKFKDSRVALAVPAGAYLGTVASTTDDVVSATSLDFLWVEGDFDATGANHGVYPTLVRRSIFRNLSVTRPYSTLGNVGLYLYQSARNQVERFGSTGSTTGVFLDQATATGNRLDLLTLEDCDNACLKLQYATQNVIADVSARRGAAYGVAIYGANQNDLRAVDAEGFYSGVIVFGNSAGNTFRDLSVAANRMHGVDVVNAGTGNRFQRVVATHNAANGINVQSSRANAFLDVLSAHNGIGMHLEAALDHRIVGLTAAYNGQAGLWVRLGSDRNYLSNLALHFNSVGLHLTASSNCTVRDLAVSDASIGLQSDGTATNRFTGRVLLGPNSVGCDPGGLAGFDGACAPNGASDFSSSVAPSIGLSFVGPVTSDLVNSTPHGSGYVWLDDVDAIWMDWAHFQSAHRAWSRSPAAQGPLGCVAAANRNQVSCSPAAWYGAAQLADWGLLASDTVLRAGLTFPTPSDWASILWSDSTTSTYLPRAVELIGDGVGNDDGLCETSEDCILTSNFGAYQGHDLPSAPTPVGTSRVYQYPSNGY